MRRASLRSQLLFDLGFLASAAVLVVGVTTAAVAGGDMDLAWRPLLLLWGGAMLVFLAFGWYLVRRLVMQPLEVLSAEADLLSRGELSGPRPVYHSSELHHLHERYRTMAEDILDAQTQMVRAEKLAGIGRLAAGVAHEVRNPLAALNTYVEVLRRRGQADAEVTEAMTGAVQRIERTVQSLLDYARPEAVPAAATADLGEATRTAVEFLRSQGLFEGHPLETEYDDHLPLVAGDRHLLEQAVLNLLLNACQAAPKGRIWVGVQARSYEPRHRSQKRRTDTTGGPPPETRDAAPRPRRPDVPPGTEGVLVYVADDGPGVPDEMRERVFDPFFTTKDPGEGTGLGLALVARTVHEAGGMVWVDRAREGGAAFKIFLPALRPA